jgi:hypothetical protein
MLGVFFKYVIRKYGKGKGLKKYILFAFFILIGIWYFKEMTVTRREVLVQAIDAIAIKKTWDSLQSLKLPNSSKVVLYTQSDRNYFYPNWYFPFKLPASYMLPLALYGRPFIDRESLGKLETNNSYINSNNKQFGYFTDIKPLALLIKQGKIDINNVIGLHFIDGSYTFEDITTQTRKLIENELIQRN